MTIVRDNMMTHPGYAPYCGAGAACRTMPRAPFDGHQFKCPSCGWRSSLDAEFVAAYKAKWGMK